MLVVRDSKYFIILAVCDGCIIFPHLAANGFTGIHQFLKACFITYYTENKTLKSGLVNAGIVESAEDSFFTFRSVKASIRSPLLAFTKSSRLNPILSEYEFNIPSIPINLIRSFIASGL